MARHLAALAALGLILPRVLPAQESTASADSLDRQQDSVIAAASMAIGHDSTKTDEYEKIIAIYKSRKQYAEELETANALVSANPSLALSHFAVGDAQLDNGAPDLAIAAFNKALVIDPAFVRARVTMAEAYSMRGAPDTALIYLNSAIHLNPRYAQAHIQRAALLTQMGNDSAAVESYAAAAELLPDSYTQWVKFARALMKAARYDEALTTIQYAISLNNMTPDPLYMLGDAYQKLGRKAEAAQTFESFMLRFPTDRRALEAERIARELNGQ